MILGLALVIAAINPAQADQTNTFSNSDCKPSVCAYSSSTIKVSCRQTASDTVSCSGSLRLFGRIDTVEFYPGFRYPGDGNWRLRGGCGFWLKGGYAQSCQFFDESDATSWTYQGYGSHYILKDHTFQTVSHTSPEPFCLVYAVSGSITLEAKTTLFGLANHEAVKSSSGAQDVWEEACASGGVPG